MTDPEKKRMLLLVRTVESLFSETCALKTVLASHRVAQTVWKREVDRLINDPELTPYLHTKFQQLYDDIEQTRDETAAFEALLTALPLTRKKWN